MATAPKEAAFKKNVVFFIKASYPSLLIKSKAFYRSTQAYKKLF
jgi:hypothetical protein